jgi:hypothetical protein
VGPRVYACGTCRTHLTSHDDIISKSFHGRTGRAYLFDSAVNVNMGPPADRLLITGLHSVCDIFCVRCRAIVGWTYLRAYEQSQQYKEGKFILEKSRVRLEECSELQKPTGVSSQDNWRKRTMSWGDSDAGTVYEYGAAKAPRADGDV